MIEETIKKTANIVTQKNKNDFFVAYQTALDDVQMVVDSYIGQPEKLTIPELTRRIAALSHLRGKDRCLL